MRLADLIKQIRYQKAPGNSPTFAKQLEKVGDMQKPEFPTSNKKTLNKPAATGLEQAQHPSPYMGEAETLTTPGPEDNPMLREHIKDYRKHATRPDMGSLNKRSYV